MGPPYRSKGEVIARIVTLALAADLQRHWSVADIGLLVGVSPSQIRRIFARELGLSPVEYLCQLRLSAASQLLADQSVRIKEVVGRVGFRDASYFGRRFRARFGLTPTAYRMAAETAGHNSSS